MHDFEHVNDSCLITTLKNTSTMTASTITDSDKNCGFEFIPYEEQWRQHTSRAKRSSRLKLFDNLFYATPDALYLLACTNFGELAIWKVPDPTWEKQNQDDDGEDPKATDFRMPLARVKISNGVLYSMKMEEVDSSKEILIFSGDEGTMIFDWSQSILETAINDKTASWKPRAQFTPNPSPLEKTIEINQACFDAGQKHLFGAAGDMFGCYKWNLETEQLLHTYRSPNRGYLHTVLLLSNHDSERNDHHLLMGGEDGILSLWDTAQDKIVEQMNMNEMNSGSGSLQSTSNNSNTISSSRKTKKRKASSSRWIGSVSQLNESWWGVGGGNLQTQQSANGNSGFLATYHASTRSLVAFSETGETIHQLAPSGNDGTTTGFWTVGNTDVVSQWNPWSLDREQQASCNSPSGFCVALAPDGRLAAGGVGPSMDLIENDQSVFRFQLE